MRKLTISIFALLFCLPLRARGDDDAMRVPLRFQEVDNLVTDGGLIRLRREYRQVDAQPIAIEGEEATVLEHHSRDKRIVADPEASGGHYIHFAKKLEFHFTVQTPGRYRVRIRGWFPLKAGYCHNEQMDDQDTRMIFDSNKGEPKVWFWTPGTEYDLAAGRHVYVFPSPNAFCAGARLDKLVLFPEGAGEEVEGLGPSASPVTTPDAGEAYTRRIKLTKIREWKLEYEAVPEGGEAVAEQAYSREGPWTPVPAGEFQAVPRPKPRYIYFRFRIRGRENAISPRLEGVRLLIHKEPRP